MRSQLYYRIAEVGDYLEYHLSSVKEEAVNLESMSRRIKLNHKELETVRERWHREIKLYEMKEVG